MPTAIISAVCDATTNTKDAETVDETTVSATSNPLFMMEPSRQLSHSFDSVANGDITTSASSHSNTSASTSQGAHSFDSSVEYFVGLFMTSDIAAGEKGNKDIAHKVTRSPTVPHPFHLTTMDKYGHRDYSCSSKPSEEREPSIERKRGMALRKDEGNHGISELQGRHVTIPNGPRLLTREKNGARSYSAFAKQHDIKHLRQHVSRGWRDRQLTVPESPRLMTTEKNGSRNYSSVSSYRSKESQSFESYPSTSSSLSSHRTPTIPRPPRLRTTEKNGERFYSTIAGNRSVGGYSFESSDISHPSRRAPTTFRPFRLRTTEKNGERFYSTFSSSGKGIRGAGSWNGMTERPLSVTVPVPFNLSVSPFKNSRAAKSHSPKYSFQALPLPNFSYRPFASNRSKYRTASTVPDPFDLSKTTRRARSHSPSVGRRQLKERTYQQPIPNFPKYNLTNTVPQPFHLSRSIRRTRSSSPMVRHKKFHKDSSRSRKSHSEVIQDHRNGARKIANIPTFKKSKTIVAQFKKPLLRKRRSLKSKHRFSTKHQGKGFKSNDTIRSDRLNGESVNPNLNASRAAKNYYLLQVAAEVARLRQEWILYKQEAQLALDALEKAKRDRLELLNEIASKSSHRDSDNTRLQKHLSKLEKQIKIKSHEYDAYKQMIKENELEMKHVAVSHKKKVKEDKRALPSVVIKGNHRNIRRTNSFKKRRKSFNKKATRDNHVNQSYKDNEEISSTFVNLQNKKEDETKDLVAGGVQDDQNKSLLPFSHSTAFTDDKIDAGREEKLENVSQECSSKVEVDDMLEDSSNHFSETDNVDKDESEGVEAADMVQTSSSKENLQYFEEPHYDTFEESSLHEIPEPFVENYEFESRDVQEEVPSQRTITHVDEENHTNEINEISTETSTFEVRQCRPKGDFGDDFVVSPLTNLFRGGWHKAADTQDLAYHVS
jgi:hypothetical protein